MNKVSIDEEISNLKLRLSELEDIHPDYTSLELKDLQTKTLTTHAHLENALDNRIRLKILGLREIKNSEKWDKAAPKLQQLLNLLSYRNKLEIVKSYNDSSDIFISSLGRVNTYRIKFAHP